MSVILKELEKRQKKLDEYEAKVEKRDMLRAELACLDKEISETNTFELKDEIKELTDYAIELKLLPAPEVDVVETEEPEEIKEAIENPTFQPTITSL